MSKTTKLAFLGIISALLISFLLVTQTAHAGFREALVALQNQDGETMLAAVKDAVDKKDDDGIILFLGILKQYPKTWRPTLNSSQQAELFNYLEKATLQSSLQAQYKLAVIPRKDIASLLITTETDKNIESLYEVREKERLKKYQDEISRLEPIANKGYAPAALQLYGNYSHNLIKNKAKAMQWLKKAAEFGNPIAAYLLGAKHLNSRNKNEVIGWYWIQEAAKQANEPSIILIDDFALKLGDLYMQGVAGNEPDYKQAYLWYRRVPNVSTYSPVWLRLETLKKLKQLKSLNPALDEAWGKALAWKEAIKSEKVIKIWQKSPNSLPKLMQGLDENNTPIRVFSMSTLRWYQPNSSLVGIVLDVFDDGRINLLIGDSTFSENNNELWMKLQPDQVKAFIGEVKSLNLKNMAWIVPCGGGCVENRTHIVTLKKPKGKEKIVRLESVTLTGNKEFSHSGLTDFLKVTEKYFPLFKLICDADFEQGRSSCSAIYNGITEKGQK